MRPTTRLRRMLDAPGIIVAPGAYDGFSARLIEAAGFKAVYMTGAGTAASHLGQPDLGLTTLTEMATHASHLASCISLPLIARTDARAVSGLDDAIARANLYREAGADVIFFEAPQSREEIERVAREVKAPLLANMVQGGKTPG